jgi:hypothetical protein
MKGKKTLLYISAGMMEITWLYALASILFLMLNYPLFPIWAAMLAFFVPIIITSALKGRGKRIIEYVLLHLLFYFSLLLSTIYFYGNWQEPFLSFSWLEMILDQQYGTVSGFAYLLVLIWFSFLWISGYKLANRSNDYFIITSRFDLGVVALIITFIILGSTNISFPRANILIIYYFLFSMLAIALAQNFRSSQTKHSSQISGTGLAVTFTLAVLLIGSWVFLFFLPQLTSAAQTGYQILKIVSRPIGNLLLKILTFLFGFKKPAFEAGPAYSGEAGIPIAENAEPSWWAQLLKWLITWGGLIFLIIFTLLLVGWLLWSLWRWFSTKTELDIEKKGFFEELWLWIKYIFSEGKRFLVKIFNQIITAKRKQEDISLLFQKLCQWGQHSGIPRKKSKTPAEYGRHLAFFFPNSQQDIQLIIDGFNETLYGKKSLSKEQLDQVKKAWRHISSPTKWFSRLQVKIFRSRKLSYYNEAISSSS